MNKDQTSIKIIVHTLYEFFNGKSIAAICHEHEIERKLFDTWLVEYKSIAMEFMELETENERLKKMIMDLEFKNRPEKK